MWTVNILWTKSTLHLASLCSWKSIWQQQVAPDILDDVFDYGLPTANIGVYVPFLKMCTTQNAPRLNKHTPPTYEQAAPKRTSNERMLKLIQCFKCGRSFS